MKAADVIFRVSNGLLIGITTIAGIGLTAGSYTYFFQRRYEAIGGARLVS